MAGLTAVRDSVAVAAGEVSERVETLRASLQRWEHMTPEERQEERRRLAAMAPRPQSATPRPPDVPRRFDGSLPGLPQASLDSYRPATPSQRAALRAVEGWTERVAGGRPTMMALIGPQGTGKSHLLYGAAYALFETHGLRAHCRPWYRLADELRYGTAASPTAEAVTHREAWQIRADLYERRIVMLDEVRPTSGTDQDATELARYACHAYDDGVSLLITTNWSTLAEVMGAPAASRFVQITLDGPDRRQNP